jgi:hypothetical protein
VQDANAVADLMQRPGADVRSRTRPARIALGDGEDIRPRPSAGLRIPLVFERLLAA